ncbi:hypothetical protein RvY_08147 [Ramazzottius varieornatus]|uniref:Protein twisted gastrulation n=1 Tax=Ramazzottius varieornatus TaxID=947166 RepID=A0A1D1V4Q8_RAMVA|nr:hypothetical protein RvY_08147 [Ramazzottius varieornatus]
MALKFSTNMDRKLVTLTVLCLTFGYFVSCQVNRGCKEAICGSIVSKCLLIDACKCDVINCTCCKSCFQCLGELFADCCQCVDMCPKEVTTPSSLNKTSHVENIDDPIPELFDALTEEHDPTGRWTSYTYPSHRDLPSFLSPVTNPSMEVGVVSKDSPRTGWSSRNCTVAFMSQCMPWGKCSKNCRSLGASSYRWFHDGCCQCVGSHCLNYGMNESRCLHCPRISPTGVLDDEYEGPEDDEEPRKHMVEGAAEQETAEVPPIEQQTTASLPKETIKKTTAPKNVPQQSLSAPQKKPSVKPAEQTSTNLMNNPATKKVSPN